ncbi:MAG TPA: tyrosine recombinase XerC [Gammaproteobacteria bacterium]|nr:tyrosine recombinase XerC [Gammaproteobacteria bacterium]HET7587984.1 tyrosine recombinase XerC [Gammaproteobacteria bacterium]
MKQAAREQLAQFLTHLRDRNLSPHTVAAYRRDLDALVDWCDRQAVDDWAAFDHGAARSYIAQRHRRGAAPRSLRRSLAAIRTFYGWLNSQRLVRHNPAHEMPMPKLPRHLPVTLDADQMAQLLEAAPDNPTAVRDYAIMELLYSSGLRLAELVALDLDALADDNTVRVTGKGSKERVVPVGSRARAALVQWRKLRHEWAAADEPALFVSRRGTRLTPRTVQNRVKQWARRQGAAANVHPHLLRHSCASHVLESSGDLRAVQELLGHANLSTTQIYTHLDFQHLARIYDEAHPRAKKKGR